MNPRVYQMDTVVRTGPKRGQEYETTSMWVQDLRIWAIFRLLSQAHKWGARLEVEQLGLESACNVEFLHGKQMLNPLCYDIHPEILNLI